MAMASGSFWHPQDARRQQTTGTAAYSQGQYSQSSLQLESFHEQFGFEGLNAQHTTQPPNSRSNIPYAPNTATGLAAHDGPRQGYAYNSNLTPNASLHGASPRSTISASDNFNGSFTFTSPVQMSTAMSENVPPHDVSGQQQQTDYLPGQSNLMLHPSVPKRRRQETLEAAGSGDEDDYGNEQYGTGGYGAFEPYPSQMAGGAFNNMQSPELLQQQGALHPIGHGPEYGQAADGNVQLGLDGKPKQSVQLSLFVHIFHN